MKKSLLFLLCLPLLARAEWGEPQFEFEEEKPWVEVVAQLPPYYQAANLIPFYVSPSARNQHFVDAASISIGADKVVRYTVVIEAVGGATNVSFEGLRCDTGERRLYAYGHPDGSWSKARNAGWENVKLRSQLSYQKALYENAFCPGGIAVNNVEEAVRNLRQVAP